MSDAKPVFFALGGPCSGKGTLCDAIRKEYNFQHISTGDVLRAEVARGTELGKKIGEIQAKGALVPPDVAVTLLKQEMTSSSCAGFLLDGFPRSEEQKKAWHDQLGEPTAVLFLDCTEEVMEQRALGRAKAAAEAGQSVRADDNVETLKKRFKTNMEQAQPVVETYKTTLGSRMKVIDATKDVANVIQQAKDFLATLQIKPVA